MTPSAQVSVYLLPFSFRGSWLARALCPCPPSMEELPGFCCPGAAVCAARPRAPCLAAGDVRGAGSGTSRPFVPTTAGLQKRSAAGGGGLGCKWSATCPLHYPQCPYLSARSLRGQWLFFRELRLFCWLAWFSWPFSCLVNNISERPGRVVNSMESVCPYVHRRGSK